MLGLFLRPEAAEVIASAEINATVRAHALELLEKGYTIVRGAIPSTVCAKLIRDFRDLEAANEAIFSENKTSQGHYPRIVNLHCLMRSLMTLFTDNPVWLEVQDVLFDAPTSLYTSLFYEVGSEQSLHRDSPVFATRPEYLYFGSTIYLEASGDENGCLEVMEGGHLLKELDREAMALDHYGSLDRVPPFDESLWVKYQDAVADQGHRCGLRMKKLYAEAGDALIWHPQLPHGGTPIRNPSRTHFSLIMHNTPVGVPVYHQEVFFRPGELVPSEAPWRYYEAAGRKIADFRDGIAFSGIKQRKYELHEFNLPA